MRAAFVALICMLSLGWTAFAADNPPAEAGGDASLPVPGDGDAEGEERLQPALITVNAHGGGTLSLNDKEASTLIGGVEIGYEKIRIFCDHIDYWQSPLAGVNHSLLDHALFDRGPAAREPEHVVFDTRATKLATIGFRGLMTPASVEVKRQPLEPTSAPEPEAKPETAPTVDPTSSKAGGNPPAPPKVPLRQVRFHILLHKLGDFTGELHAASGWIPHAGWADEAELIVIGDVAPTGIINPRFESIYLVGRPQHEAEPKRPAKLVRFKQPLNQTKVETLVGSKGVDASVRGSTLTIDFDPAGRVLRLRPGLDAEYEGNPSLDMPLEKPAPAKSAPAKSEPGHK